MPREPINPATLFPSLPFGFSQAVRQSGGDTLHIAGQTAWNASGALIGAGDLRAQARQALANLREALATAGAGPADIVRLRTYVVGHTPDKLDPIVSELLRFYDGVIPAANTLIGVQALALPEFLIEIEATAIID